MDKPVGTFVVGISGGSGSGKTYLQHLLKEMLPPQKVTFVSQDDYYKPKDQLAKDENGIINFDHPDCIKHENLAKDIESLKCGNSVTISEYTFNNPTAAPKSITLKPTKIIIVEGLFCFYLKDIASKLDFKIYVDANEKVMLDRRITRDAEERNYDRSDVIYRYEHHVLPAFKKYTLPFKKAADIVVNNFEKEQIQKAAEVISGHLINKFV